MEKLATRYRLAVITNTQGQASSERHRLDGHPQLVKAFEVIIVAGESDMPPKPDSAPFLKCLDEMHLTPAEAVYVGDDWRIDICGALDVGIQPIWLQHHSTARNWPKVETTVPIISSLERLLDMDAIGF